jgi:hypothetical protein
MFSRSRNVLYPSVYPHVLPRSVANPVANIPETFSAAGAGTLCAGDRPQERRQIRHGELRKGRIRIGCNLCGAQNEALHSFSKPLPFGGSKRLARSARFASFISAFLVNQSSKRVQYSLGDRISLGRDLTFPSLCAQIVFEHGQAEVCRLTELHAVFAV